MVAQDESVTEEEDVMMLEEGRVRGYGRWRECIADDGNGKMILKMSNCWKKRQRR